MPEIPSVSFVVITGGQAGGRNPSTAKKEIDQKPAISVERLVIGAHRPGKRLHYPDLFVGAVFGAKFRSRVGIMDNVEIPKPEGEKIGFLFRLLRRSHPRGGQSADKKKCFECS